MNSVILKIASKYVQWILVTVAVVALIRGHNNPGGGFIGGLLAGLAVVYNGFAFSMKRARQSMRIAPESFIALGFVLALLSIVPGFIRNRSVMEGVWYSLSFEGKILLKIGTPFIFDIGVFFVVFGITILFIYSLSEKE